MSNDSRLLEERIFADAFSEKLPSDAQARWSACKSAHRFMAFENKQIVAYSLLFGKPQVQRIITCKGIDAGLKSGLSSFWTDEDGNSFWVSHTPTEIAPSCFLWHVKRSELAYIPFKDTWSLKFSLAYRTPHNPTIFHEGCHYLLEKAVFDSFQWPNT